MCAFLALAVLWFFISTPTTNAAEFNLGTYNVLEEGDEFNPSFGCPLQIKLCGETHQMECTLARRLRVWSFIESKAVELDVLVLQEAEAGFLALQPAGSAWKVTAVAGCMAVLRSNTSSFDATGAISVPLSGMSDGPEAPVALMTNGIESIAVASVHVAAAMDIGLWLANATQALEQAVADGTATIVIAGDFNHNMTTASFSKPPWCVHSSMGSQHLGGTSQKEFNWMGDFDAFVSNGAQLKPNTTAKAILRGFMPKVVKDLPLNGEVQHVAQFASNAPEYTELKFSQTSIEPFALVPYSNPTNETLSDHLMVTATFIV